MDNSAWPNARSAAPRTARVGKGDRERADLIWNEDRVGRKIMPKDALTRRRGWRPAGFCQEQTPVMIEQCRSMERDAFHVSYLSDKTPEAVFHGQTVQNCQRLFIRSSTTQQDSGTPVRRPFDRQRTLPARSVGWVRSSPSSTPSPRLGPRAGSSGARKACWASHGSTTRRTTSSASSSWAFPRPPSQSSRGVPYFFG